MSGGDWANLPSVVLIDIYGLLPLNDRLNASAACTNWRLPLFSIPIKLNLVLDDYERDIDKYEFLVSKFAHKTPSFNLILNAASLQVLSTIFQTLEKKIAPNSALKTISINYTLDSIYGLKSIYQNNDAELSSNLQSKILTPLLKVLQNRNNLEFFNCPVTEELLAYNSSFAHILSYTTKIYTLKKLALTTVRSGEITNNNNVELMPTTTTIPYPAKFSLENFQILTELIIDTDLLTNEVLLKVGERSKVGGLKTLSLISYAENKNITPDIWSAFNAQNPNCGVELTVCGPFVKLEEVSNLSSPIVKLTAFRALYCTHLNWSLLTRLIKVHEDELEELEVVSEGSKELLTYATHGAQQGEFPIDPLIYAAWICKKLKRIKIGYLYYGENLIGIARLVKPHFRKLEIDESQMVLTLYMKQICNEIGKVLPNWKPSQSERVCSKQLRKRKRNEFNTNSSSTVSNSRNNGGGISLKNNEKMSRCYSLISSLLQNY